MINTDDLEIRDEKIDGQGPWLWPKSDGPPGSDGGAWGGPKDDWEQHHKPNILKYVENFDTVVQAGGACGMYPKLYSYMFKKVYTFEPDAINFYCLVHNCTESNIIKYQAALIHDHQSLTVQRHLETNVGMHTVGSDRDGLIIGMRVDDLNLAKVDLIHLDIEHCEYYALLGAMNTIKTHRPVLFIERGITDQIKQLLVAENYVLQGKSGYADYIWTYTGE